MPPSCRVDQHLVMGSLKEIRQRPAAPLPAVWTLRRVDAAESIGPGFEALYQDFHAARPDLRAAAPASTLEDLGKCAAQGGLYGCFEGTVLVGVVAAEPCRCYGVQGWQMWDIVLARRYCGKGLGAALERAVLDCLDPQLAPLVVGTIDGRNSASLRTAQRVGRQSVGRWVFVDT